MNEQQARDVILKALCDVAPEIDASSVDPEVPFQEQLDLDSMDFLNYVTGIEEDAGILIPETDYGRLDLVRLHPVRLVRRAGGPGASPVSGRNGPP